MQGLYGDSAGISVMPPYVPLLYRLGLELRGVTLVAPTLAARGKFQCFDHATSMLLVLVYRLDLSCAVSHSVCVRMCV